MTELIGEVLANPFVSTLLVGIVAAVVGLWLAASWWAYRDAARRVRGELPPYLAATWILLSGPVLLPLSVAVYALVRPQETAADRRTRELLAGMGEGDDGQPACPACGADVEPDWVRCPACAAWTVRRCGRCDRPAPLDADICPWCAWVPGESTDVEPARPFDVEFDVPAAAVARPPVLARGRAPRPVVIAVPRAVLLPARAGGRSRAPGVRRHRVSGAMGRAGGPKKDALR